MFGNINLLTIFTTGLLTGGLTCMAVQGGLLAATLAQREEEKLKTQAKSGNALPILSFLVAKLVAYTILGLLLGWLGSLFELSLQAKVVLQVVVVIFMFGTALNILNVHPIFRYFVIQPPRFLTRLVRKQSKRKETSPAGRQVFAPAILGGFTIFIPCGTTQAMMALAVGSGNPLMGGAILFAFVLGTSPIFFLLGYMTMKLGDVLQKRFMKIAAFAIILIAVFNLDSAIALSGSQYTGRQLLRDGFCLISYCDVNTSGGTTGTQNPVNEQTVVITPTGYSPSQIVVKSGSKVTLHLVNKGASGCIQAFTIPSMNIQKVVPPNKTGELTFTAPSKPGNVSFMCSMGMYPGTIEVI